MNCFVIYCDICYQTPLITKDQLNYLVTSCGKIICNNCSTKYIDLCPKCKSIKCQRKLINNQLDINVQTFLKSTKNQINNLQNVDRFQRKRMKHFAKFLYNKMEQAEKTKMELKCRIKNLEKMREEKLKILAHKKELLNEHYIQQKNQHNHSLTKQATESSFSRMFKYSIENNNVQSDQNLFNPQYSKSDYKTPIMKYRKPMSIISKKSTLNKMREDNAPYMIFSSTPKSGHDNQDFGTGTNAPSSIFSLPAALYFRKFRENYKTKIN